MATRNVRANTGYYRRRRNNCAHDNHEHHSDMLRWLIIFASALILTLLVAAPAAAVNEGCGVSGSTADCADVPADGILYGWGVTDINVDDGEPGETVVAPGNLGIGLYLYASTGNSDIDTDFGTIYWDTDSNPDTDPVRVVSNNESGPLLVDGQYIFAGDGDPPEIFTIGTETYTGDELAELLSDPSVAAGGSVDGFLTINSEAPFTTLNAGGIAAISQGGHGGNGGCWTILLIYTHCNDGRMGGSAGSVAVNNNAAITVTGTMAGSHGVAAISQGGRGGRGGQMIGAVATAGGGGNGGAGGDVAVMLGTESAIATHSPESHGVFARSHGGDGGAAGWVGGIVALGDTGGNGGDAGNVSVDNYGSILTTGWNSHGILAQSIGAGAGSGSDTGGIYAEGGNGGGESDGAMVTINNYGIIETQHSDSYGLLAQSIGGGGGDGGGAGGWFTVGGRGGSGGGSGIVSVFDSGTVQTSGDRSTAIFAQSIGDEVHVVADGSDIDTTGDDAHGIHAQSIGGGGGNGGVAVAGAIPAGPAFSVSIALGGNAGGGGNAGEVVEVITSESTTIDTAGTSSYGIVAQSIGGGGGNGGSGLAGSGGGGINVSVGVGGTGGVAGDANLVDIDNAATITTGGDFSTGIVAQSIGGGGGNGGSAGSLAIGGSMNVGVTLGGDGSAGGVGGQVDIINSGTIATGGENAIGIFAQSVGGSGGNGGSSLSGSVGLASVGVSIAGGGGDGNDGGLVNILNAGEVLTGGNNSSGIFAQSIGGGGGNGGNATSIALAGPLAVTVGIGGTGGSGGVGGNVDVINDTTGVIATEGINSDGIFAQSVGGGGGSGGNATTASLAFPVEIEEVEIPAISASVALGGAGGDGGAGGIVDVDNFGNIETFGLLSNGIFAQSLGGSGGRGGSATNVQITVDALFTGSVVIGGSGGDGGIGNLVSVDNLGQILTHSDFSNGIFAQSVGGGGGLGGNATTVSLSLTPPPTSLSDLVPTPDMSFHVAVGGDGGAGGIGGNVDVTNEATIVTDGHFSSGIMAQSVGGSGGVGGDARVISVELTADPMDFNPFMDLMSFNTTLVFGGDGGDGGNGGNVTVTNDLTELEMGGIATSGAFSHGIVAQSVGGNGGSGGSAMTFEFSNADIMPDIPVLDDITGLTTIEMTLQGSGGSGGDGGDVTVNSFGNVWTEGDFSMGVIAQSVAGGGGLAGFYNPHGISNSEIVNTLFNTIIDTDAGLSFAGSAGGSGTAGAVIVNHTGDIQTLGDGAHGLFAQSAAGSGVGGNVDIILDGNIHTFGEWAYGIFAQSGGLGGNGDITITLNDGIVMGGSGSGSGIFIGAGSDNSVWNDGLITSVSGIDGYAIRSTSGDETIENYGTIVGSFDLGTGENHFVNYGLINAGTTLNAGPGSLLLNEGDLVPGGVMNIFTTNIGGDFVQSEAGTLWFDLMFDFGLDSWDVLTVDGSSDLNGTLGLVLFDTGSIMPGSWEAVLLSSDEGISEFGLSLDAPISAVVGFSLMGTSATDYSLFYDVDFAPTGLTRNQSAMGEHFNAIQLAGSTEPMKPLTASIVAQPDLLTLGAAYDLLSPHIYAENQLSRLFSSLDFEQSMHSCAVRDTDLRFSREGECTWMRVSERDIEYEGRHGLPQATDYSNVFNVGFQRAMTEHWHGGLAFGVENTDFELVEYADRDGTQYQLGGIVKGRYGQNAIDLSLSMGRGDYDTRRYTEFSYDGEHTRAQRDISYAAIHAAYGYTVERDNWYVRPGVDLGWTDISGDGFAETDAGPTALIVEDTDDAFLTSRFDLRIGGEIAADNQVLYRPFMRAAFTHIHSGTTNEISAKLAGAPAEVPYFTQVTEVDDNYMSLSAGIDILTREQWVLSFAYDRQMADRWDSDSFFAKLMFEL
jgi:uncharacterized protein YhjY with autotransporter beta-barrel domain